MKRFLLAIFLLLFPLTALAETLSVPMPEFTKYLNADMAMVVVTIVLVQIIKGLLPSPAPDDPMGQAKIFATVERLKWIPLASAFIIGTALAFLLDMDAGEVVKSKLRGGLQTGAYAVAAWEIYSASIQPTVERMFGRRT